jgi:hypothetical protein
MGTNHALPRNGSGQRTKGNDASPDELGEHVQQSDAASGPAWHVAERIAPGRLPARAPRFDSARMMGRASWRVSWPRGGAATTRWPGPSCLRAPSFESARLTPATIRVPARTVRPSAARSYRRRGPQPSS